MNAVAAADVAVELDGARVLERASVSVDEGEWVALIGRNGAGKTTLLRAIAALVPYTGSIRIWGEEASRLPRRELARRVAVVPQIPVIPEGTSVLDYVLLGRTPHVSFIAGPGEEDLEAAHTAIERLDIAAFAPRRLGSLSGGELQRAVLARAIAQGPRLLLLDEPTSALDIGAQQAVMELVSTLRAGGALTVVSATHDLTLAGQYADRLVLMDGGRDVATGLVSEVLTEELVARHYGASVTVLDGDGGVAVIPLRVADAANGDR